MSLRYRFFRVLRSAGSPFTEPIRLLMVSSEEGCRRRKPAAVNRSRTTSDFETRRSRDSTSICAANSSGTRTVSVFMDACITRMSVVQDQPAPPASARTRAGYPGKIADAKMVLTALMCPAIFRGNPESGDPDCEFCASSCRLLLAREWAGEIRRLERAALSRKNCQELRYVIAFGLTLFSAQRPSPQWLQACWLCRDLPACSVLRSLSR